MTAPWVGGPADPDEPDTSCRYSPTPDDPSCGRPATRHVATYSAAHEKIVGLLACDEHEPQARESGRFYNVHDVTPACGVRYGAWTTHPHVEGSWCE